MAQSYFNLHDTTGTSTRNRSHVAALPSVFRIAGRFRLESGRVKFPVQAKIACFVLTVTIPSPPTPSIQGGAADLCSPASVLLVFLRRHDHHVEGRPYFALNKRGPFADRLNTPFVSPGTARHL